MSSKNTTAGTEVPYDNMSEGCDCWESGARCGRHPLTTACESADKHAAEEADEDAAHSWAVGRATRAQRERNVMASSQYGTGANRG